MYLKQGTFLQGRKYRIEKVLREKAFGISYLATQTSPECLVVIKEFFPSFFCGRNEASGQMFVRNADQANDISILCNKFITEAQLVFKMNHNNIIHILDIFEENDTAYFVVEHTQRGSVSDVVTKNGPLPEAKAREYILQVAEALRFLHSTSINHLNITPSNIIISNEDIAMLADFGVSKHYYVSTTLKDEDQMLEEEHSYQAYEQKCGPIRFFSPEVDIFSLAATYHFMLTGKAPEIDLSELSVVTDKLEAKGVSKESIEAIVAALQPDSKNRTQNIADFIAELNTDVDSRMKTQNTENAYVPPREDRPTKQEKTSDNGKKKNAVGKKIPEGNVSTNHRNDFSEKKSHARPIAILLAVVLIVAGVGYALYNNSNNTVAQSVNTETTNSNEAVMPEAPVEDTTANNVQENMPAIQPNANAGQNANKATILLTKGPKEKRSFVYTGPLDSEGMPDGKGTAEFPAEAFGSPSVFTGEFSHGSITKGELTFSAGGSFKGTFNDGQFSEGTLTEADGRTFTGKFKKGTPGKGDWRTPDGKKIKKDE